jgi:xylono-1,5-lactonase
LVVTGRNVAYKELGGTSITSVLLDARALPQTSGFNDLTVDGRGRVYVGSVATGALDSDFTDPSAPPSLLVLIDLDGTARVLSDDIRLANGLAFSPDGRVLYVCDSGRRAVLSFDVNPDSGDVAGRRLLVQADTGVPDGMAVAADGSIWVALAHVGLVARYTPEGQPIGAWHTPDEFVTSLCFGGPDGRQVYITTGASSPDVVAGVYAATADVAGAEVPRAQVATHCP